jgi:hypothetical protein
MQFKSLEQKLADVEAEIKGQPPAESSAEPEALVLLEERKQELLLQIKELSVDTPSGLSKTDDDARSVSDSDCSDAPTSQGLTALLHAADGLSLEYQSYVEKAAAEERARYEAYRAEKEEQDRSSTPTANMVVECAFESERSMSLSHLLEREGPNSVVRACPSSTKHSLSAILN